MPCRVALHCKGVVSLATGLELSLVQMQLQYSGNDSRALGYPGNRAGCTLLSRGQALCNRAAGSAIQQCLHLPCHLKHMLQACTPPTTPILGQAHSKNAGLLWTDMRVTRTWHFITIGCMLPALRRALTSCTESSRAARERAALPTSSHRCCRIASVAGAASLYLRANSSSRNLLPA